MQTLVLLLTLSVFPLKSFADAGCDYSLRGDVELEDQMRGPEKRDRVINLSDRKDSGYFAHATLSSKGVMVFTIKTHDERGASAVLNAEDSFRFLLDRLGDGVKEIHCIWRWGENHKEFNRLTGIGMDPETAAKLTWEGQQVLRAGFTNFEITETYGRPGKYRDVEVTFRKPAK